MALNQNDFKDSSGKPILNSYFDLFNHFGNGTRAVSFLVQSYNPTFERYSLPVQITFANADLDQDNIPYSEHFVTAPATSNNPFEYRIGIAQNGNILKVKNITKE
ncbi:MAG: hypothetical protein KJ941_10285 [Bacteroidetes bacterium]|nr:hypothetical protein [Bacteroidota bacterium]